MVPQDMFQTRSHQPFAHGERKNAVYFNFPYYSVDETHITFPATYHVENLAEVKALSTTYAFYNLNHKSEGGTLVVTREFGMGGIAFQQKDYEDLRKFYSAVSTGDAEPLVLTTAK